VATRISTNFIIMHVRKPSSGNRGPRSRPVPAWEQRRCFRVSESSIEGSIYGPSIDARSNPRDCAEESIGVLAGNQTQAPTMPPIRRKAVDISFGRTPAVIPGPANLRPSEGGSSSRNSPNSKRGVGVQLNGGGGDNRRCPSRRVADHGRRRILRRRGRLLASGIDAPRRRSSGVGRNAGSLPRPVEPCSLLASSRKDPKILPSSNAGRTNGAIEAHCFARRLAFARRWHFARWRLLAPGSILGGRTKRWFPPPACRALLATRIFAEGSKDIAQQQRRPDERGHRGTLFRTKTRIRSALAFCPLGKHVNAIGHFPKRS
jgi:hypothetical protein